MKGWEKITLGDACKKHNGIVQTGPFGSQLHEYDYVQEGVPVIMPKDIIGNTVNETSIARIKPEMANSLAKHKVKAGDIVFPRRGEISKRAYIRSQQEGFICGTGCLKISFKDEFIHTKFLNYFLAQQEIIEWLESNAVGATMKNISGEIIKKLPILLPPLPIQRRIASILSAYDDMIENNLRRIRLLEELAQRTYEEWFVRFRVHGEALEVDEATGLPVGWRKVACIDAMEVMSGGTPKTDNESFWNGSIQFFTPKDASSFVYTDGTEKMVTEIGVKKCNSKLYPLDTVFITARGTVGKLNLAAEPMAMNQSCYALKGKGYISQFYLYNSLFAAMEQFKAASNGGVFNTIVVDTFRYLTFVMPPQKFVEDFTLFVKPIYSQVKNLITQNRLLREARDILLPRLMGGEVEV